MESDPAETLSLNVDLLESERKKMKETQPQDNYWWTNLSQMAFDIGLKRISYNILLFRLIEIYL
jgi:hypothetical protein